MKNNGKYQQNCEILLAHIYNLCHYGKLKKCTATTERLAQAFEHPISERQIYRYLKSLRDADLIEVSTSKLKKDGKTKSLYKTREITVKGPEPKLSKEVSRTSLKLRVFSVGQKKVVISAKKPVSKPVQKVEVKSVAPTPTLPKTDDVWAKVEKEMKEMGFSPKIHQYQSEGIYVLAEDPSLSLYEASEIAKERYELQEEFDIEMQAKLAWEAQQRQSSIEYIRAVSGDIEDPDNVLEEAWQLHLQQRKEYEEAKELLENEEKLDYSDEEWAKVKQQRLEEEIGVMAQNIVVKDGEFWLKVSPNGVIVREIKLFDYVTWGPRSPEFQILKQEYGKIRAQEK